MRTPKLIAIFLAAFAITSYAATANELKATIEAYGLSAEIIPSAVGNTEITVTGTATNKTSGLSLDIGSLLNVYWDASLSGSISVPGPAAPNPNCLVSISGDGNFTVRDGGKIELTGSGYGLCNSGKASISKGGEVSATGGGTAVSNQSTMGIGGKVSLTGGLNGLAIYNGSTGNLMIQGSAEILVTGIGNLAIRNASGGTVSMNNGVVFGYGATDANIIDGEYSQQSGGTNVIIAWNKPAGNNPTYTAGTSNDIFKKPAAATAVWSNKEGKAGIDYDYSNNNNGVTGFIAINGVTVVNPSSSSGQNPSSSSVGGSSSSSDDPTPIRLTNNTIVLENLPAGTKIEVYNLQGKRIYSGYPENSKILRIPVQTKGIYIIKQTSPANTHSQYFRLSPL
ncbi:MAG: T9SS type A sorting domain-containing protein [Fibromonadaceae bacterium]|jgi:hypothetical protein|nr:T9SS type A sorting domain-containing protein [Fibromonadaceae bacterium]